MLDGTYYFDCECGSPEHTLRFTLNKEESELYAEIYLYQHRSWFKRAWVGLRYIFGYQSKHGAWDSWTLKKADTKRLISLFEEINSKGGTGEERAVTGIKG